MNTHDDALVSLGRFLRTEGYRFTTITPESHRRVNARAGNELARDVRDVLGWSRPFRPEILPRIVMGLLERAGAVVSRDGHLASTVRYSTLGDGVYVHSAYPTTGSDAVFFGPDTYRFAALLDRSVTPARRLVDVGCGSGAGGLSIASRADAIVLSDINPLALRLAEVNAKIAGISHVEFVHSDVLAGVAGEFDAVVSNPPYLRDALGRTYRDGGGRFGEALSTRIARAAFERLAPGGQLVLYTASAIVEGTDTLRAGLAPLWEEHADEVRYSELDPDVFGEELEGPSYDGVDRIAVVGLQARRRGAATKG